jgi:hypothetical protein
MLFVKIESDIDFCLQATPNRFPDEDPNGNVDPWFNEIVIPPITATQPSIALIVLMFEGTREWVDYLTSSYSYAAQEGMSFFMCISSSIAFKAIFSGIDVFVYYTYKSSRWQVKAPNVYMRYISIQDLFKRVSDVLGSFGIKYSHSLFEFIFFRRM